MAVKYIQIYFLFPQSQQKQIVNIDISLFIIWWLDCLFTRQAVMEQHYRSFFSKNSDLMWPKTNCESSESEPQQ